MPDTDLNPTMTASTWMVRPTLRYQDGFRNVSPNLRDAVMELQSLLVQQGYQVNIDGLFGLGTHESVRDFQIKHRLTPDGIVGNQTWALLTKATFPTLRLNDGLNNSPQHIRDAVTKMQKALIAKGYVLKADGRFGYGTEGMVKEFQEDYGLMVTGVVEEGTWKILLDPTAQPVPHTPDEPTNGGGDGVSVTPPVTPPVVTPPVTPPVVTTPAMFFKDDLRVNDVDLEPEVPLVLNPAWSGSTTAMAKAYNRVGGLLQALGNVSGIEPYVALGVFKVETSGREHRKGKTVIRFENHKFYDAWGKANKNEFDKYYRFGGVNSAGQPVARHKNHQFRKSVNESFRLIHVVDYETQQNNEYEALNFAIQLCGDREIALSCISLGLSQIMGFNHSLIGYDTVGEMYDAFQESEGAHVLGFFDFCKQVNKKMLGYIERQEWVNFALLYNGSGNEQVYGSLIKNAVAEAKKLGI